VQVFWLTRHEYFRQPLSATFHGPRSVCPVAAAVSKGARPEDVGERINDPVSFSWAGAGLVRAGKTTRSLLHIDHFGNCITNFTQEDLAELGWMMRQLLSARKVIKRFRRCFSESAEGDRPDQIFAIWGSAGFWSWPQMNKSAAQMPKGGAGPECVASWPHQQNTLLENGLSLWKKASIENCSRRSMIPWANS